MSDSKDFLSFLINESIYVIDEKESIIADSPLARTNQEDLNDEQTHTEAPLITLNSTPNLKHEILILFDNPSADGLTSADLDYLKKILTAIGRSIEQVEFFNVASAYPAADGYRYVIAFTPNHQLAVPISSQQYTVLSLGEGHLIIADALNNISASTDLRKKLWEVLKSIFID